MKELIRKFEKESGLEIYGLGARREKWEAVLEKYAELVVRECMKVAVNKDSGYIHPANVAGYMAAGRSTAAQMIKEHFGVEE